MTTSPIKEKNAYYSGISAPWLIYFAMMIGIVGGLVGYGIVVPLYLLGRLFPGCRRFGGRVLRRGVSLLMRLQPWFYGEFKVGELAPGLTISNHRSHLDAFLLLCTLPGVRFVAKSRVFLVPFVGWFMSIYRCIPIERGSFPSYSEAMEKVRSGIRDGDYVHVFAEMTRCPMGFVGTQGFHLAPFLVAAQEKVPIVPIVIYGTDEVWPRGRFGLSFRKKVSIKALEPVHPNNYQNAAEFAEAVRTRIDGELKLINSQSVPVVVGKTEWVPA